MLNKLFLLIVILVVQSACTMGLGDISAEKYRYRADFFSIDPDSGSVKDELVFVDNQIYRSESDVIESFEGCSRRGSLLALKSSLLWLEFEVDLSSDPRNYNEAEWGDLVLKYDSMLFGEAVKVLGIKRHPDTLTVVYYSPFNGVLGMSLLDSKRRYTGDYIQPIYWLEGREGICHAISGMGRRSSS